MALPERRPALEEDDPFLMRRPGERRPPTAPSDSELLDFFFGRRSLQGGSNAGVALRLVSLSVLTGSG